VLAFGCREQGVWELAEGDPEPWGREALFAPKDLAIWSEGTSGAEAAELRRIWAVAEVRAGSMVPSIDAREPARVRWQRFTACRAGREVPDAGPSGLPVCWSRDCGS
jgi:hypothetical protein